MDAVDLLQIVLTRHYLEESTGGCCRSYVAWGAWLHILTSNAVLLPCSKGPDETRRLVLPIAIKFITLDFAHCLELPANQQGDAKRHCTEQVGRSTKTPLLANNCTDLLGNGISFRRGDGERVAAQFQQDALAHYRVVLLYPGIHWILDPVDWLGAAPVVQKVMTQCW